MSPPAQGCPVLQRKDAFGGQSLAQRLRQRADRLIIRRQRTVCQLRLVQCHGVTRFCFAPSLERSNRADCLRSIPKSMWPNSRYWCARSGRFYICGRAMRKDGRVRHIEETRVAMSATRVGVGQMSSLSKSLELRADAKPPDTSEAIVDIVAIGRLEVADGVSCHGYDRWVFIRDVVDGSVHRDPIAPFI
jgi:hypothetical protein